MKKSKPKGPDPFLSHAQSASKIGDKPWSAFHTAITQSKWGSIKGYARHRGLTEGRLRGWICGTSRVPRRELDSLERDFPRVEFATFVKGVK